jgi:eukaryotic-like serine/threonine-protein kinase
LSENQAAGNLKVGRYEILRELGRGAMGVVYEARDPALGRTVALKTIHPGIAGKLDLEAFEARFFTEARVAARLQHPGIVIVHDVGRDSGSETLFIALEHLRGRTLAELTDGGRALPWREAARIMAGVARSLHHAHLNGVVHRDMKPANVMVLASGETKIMDFGIAKIEASLHHLTTPGEFLGTPLYMAPEQAQGGLVTPRTDVFALGAIGFTLLTGRPAFAGETVARIVVRVVSEDPGPPSLIAPGVPPEIDGIVARALAKDPAARYPDAQAMAEDLEAVIESRTPLHLSGAGTSSPRLPVAPEVELVFAEDDPVQQALHALVAEAPPPTPTEIPRPQRPPAQPSYSRRLVRRFLLVSAGVVGGAAVTYFFVNRPVEPGLSPPATTAPDSEAASSPAPPSVAASPGVPGEAGKLAVDFEHSLRSGLLRIWLDEELVVEQRLAGQAEKRGLLFTVRKGSYKDTLEVPPGRHTLRVRVAWEDNDKTERIVGFFKPGVTRRLQVRLGRLRKNVSLEWE